MSEWQNCERCGKPIAATHWFCGVCWRELRNEGKRDQGELGRSESCRKEPGMVLDRALELVADGVMTARDSDGESTWPIIRQDEHGRRQALHIAAAVNDALKAEGFVLVDESSAEVER